MSCPSRDELDRYLRDELAPESQASVEAHCESCAACMAILCAHSEVPRFVGASDATIPGWTGELASRLARQLKEQTTSQPWGSELALPALFGDYELLAVLGRGGMGTVYCARQLSLNRPVAVKIIRHQLLKPNVAARFHLEATSAAQLNHPGIVPIFEVGQQGSYLYYTMAYMPGGSLAEQLIQGPLEPQRAAALVSQIADAVHYAHEHGVIHRDLKPSNILLETDGRPKVADFGLVKQLSSESSLTETGEILGTPAYMPPEQAMGSGKITIASDVYGLGAILYSLLTGRSPFFGDDPLRTLYRVVHEDPSSIRQSLPDLSPDLETIVQKCLSKRPRERYESAAELGRELERYLRGEPIQARPLGPCGRASRWCRRHPALSAMSATAVLVLIAGSVVSLYFGWLASSRATRLQAVNSRLIQTEQAAKNSAKAARHEANAAIQQARVTMRILETTLYDLQRAVVDDPAAQEQRRDLLSAVLAGLDDLESGAHIEVDRLERCRATATLGLAEVVMQLGDEHGQTGETASRKLFVSAIDQFQSLLDRAPENATAATDLLAGLIKLGDMLANAGDWRSASDCFSRALPIATQHAARNPGHRKLKIQLAHTELLVGESFVELGQLDDGGALLMAGRDRCRELLAEVAFDHEAIFLYLQALQELGDWHELRREQSEARACYEEMRNQATLLTQRRPHDAHALMDLSTAWERLGVWHRNHGELQAALRDFRESLRMAETAGRAAPENTQLQWDVSFGYQQVADVCLSLDELEEAFENARLCVELRQHLALRDPLNRRLHGKLWHALRTLAVVSEKRGDLAGACTWHRAVVDGATAYHARTGSEVFAAELKRAREQVERCQGQLDRAEGAGTGKPEVSLPNTQDL